jgi:hypothetical protein
MRASFVALALATLVVVAATALYMQADVPEEPLAPATAESAGAVSWHANVTSFDGTLVPITIYKPALAFAGL